MSAEGAAAQVSLLRGLGRYVARHYDRRSPVALVLLVTIGAAVGYRWSDLLDVNGTMDWLLGGVWVWMAALICWNVTPRRDVLMVAVGACGGGVIEWWGTNTGLWFYFTQERPPLWILPAWPLAAITVDRMAKLLDWILEELARRRSRDWPQRVFVIAYWLVVPGFVIWMTSFVWPYAHIFASQVVIALMVGVTLHCPNPRRDVVIFVAGAMLGIFLEYWGTSRACWTYYTREVPPPVAVVAHGFAALAFTRAAGAIERLFDWVALRAGRLREA